MEEIASVATYHRRLHRDGRAAVTQTDPTAAERARRYRARKRESRALAPVPDAPVAAFKAITVPKPSRLAVATSAARVTPLPPESRISVMHGVVAIAVAGLGAVLAAVGIYLNSSFLFSFGRSTDAGILLAALGLVIDGVTLVLPSATALLWRDGRHGAAVTAAGITVVAFGMTLLATIGFVSTHMGDAVALRGSVAFDRTGLVERIERLRAERERLGSVALVGPESAVAARAAVAEPMVARDQECDRVGPNCRKRVGELTDRQAELAAVLRGKALADQAAAIETELAGATKALASLPAIGAADPQTEGAAALVSWASAGRVNLTPHDVAMARTFGLTMMPGCAGLLFVFAIALFEPALAIGSPSAAPRRINDEG